jgi:RND family efflux transporter MFP subunit
MTKETAKGYVQFILIIIFLAGIYALNFGLALLKTPPKINNKNNSVPTVQAVTIKAVTQKISFSNTAQIVARTYIPITPEISGRIIWVADNFKIGSCFKANQTLFKIDTDNAQAELERAKSDLQQAEASLALVQAEAKAAISEWKILNPKDNIPDLVARKPQIHQAQAMIKTANARLTLAKIGFKNTYFSLPFDGCVESSKVEVGQFVNAGMNGGQSLGQVFSKNAIEALVNLPIKKTQFIQSIPHNVTLEIQHQEYPSKIDRISDIIESSTQFSQVILKPQSHNIILQPNKIATAIFTTKTPQSIFIIQENDLIDNHYIRVIDDNNHVIKQKIIIISRSDTQIYIQAFADKIKIVRGNYLDFSPKTVVKIVE